MKTENSSFIIHHSPRRSRLRRSAGSSFPLSSFSLIELMVVVFVIALLLSLVATGVRRARELAMKTRCQNNLREHGVSLAQRMVSGAAADDLTGKAGGWGAVTTLEEGEGGIITLKGEDGVERPSDWMLQDKHGVKAGSGGQSLSSSGSGYGEYLDFVIDPEVRHCPSVDTESLIDTNSPSFKGYRTTTKVDTTTYWDYQFTETNKYNTDISYIQTATYAFNTANTGANYIAYIDWNAEQGWNGYLSYTNWMFNNSDKGIVQDTPKGDNWWKTEVGFHHLNGANYVTWDGHVGWVESNDIDWNYFSTNAF